MKRIIKKIYFRCGFLTKPIYGGIGQILMFHRVCPIHEGARLAPNRGMEMTPEELEFIIQYFNKANYDFISMDHLYMRLKKKSSKKKFVIFTFDDGYRDNLIYGYPILKKYNVPFTIYITTSFPDHQAILWWYLLEDLLIKEEGISIKLNGQQIVFDCSETSKKEDVFLKIRSTLLHIQQSQSDCSSVDRNKNRINEIFEPFGMDVLQKVKKLALSWEQIRQLNRDPLVTIGAHTVNHLSLSPLTLADAKNEIFHSKEIIESHLREEVIHFAYPFGGSEEAQQREFNLMKEIGFKTAVTTRFASIFPQHLNFMECLPRIFVPSGIDKRFLHQVRNGTLTGISNHFKRVVTL